MSKYSHLLYKRGYLLSETRIAPPVPTWTQKRIGRYHIYFDPDNLWSFQQEGSNWVALMGRAVDILHWSTDIEAIVGHLLVRMGVSGEDMLDYVDHLSGRFIIVYHTGNSTKLMTDAFGTRTAFYSLRTPLMVASHCRIIADLLNSGECSRMAAIKRDRRWPLPSANGYPGLLTPFEGVHILTPNTLINLEQGEVQRFYPREELPACDLPEVVEEVSVMLKRQLELLHDRCNLAISLTGGVDTRTTLAAARDVAEEVLFVTYGYRGEQEQKDVPLRQHVTGKQSAGHVRRWYERERRDTSIDTLVATEMADALELRHVRLCSDMGCQEDMGEFNRVLDRNVYRQHRRGTAMALLSSLPPNALHIRSNLSDIGKCFYRHMGFRHLPLTEERMAHAWRQMQDIDPAIEAFGEFSLRTRFDTISNFGYDPYDMFYWEHRAATWLSLVLLEQDVAFDTFELFNCRVLAEKVLSVPAEHRLRWATHYGVIKRLWPVLLQWPINEPPYKQQLAELRAEHQGAQARQEELSAQLEAAGKSMRQISAELTEARRSLRRCAHSLSFQLGNLLVRAVRYPGRNTILLPYRFVRLCVTILKSRRAIHRR